MFVGTPQTNPVLQALQQSPYKFYLTGSRFFIPEASQNSDFDYLVEADSEVKTFLLSLGFSATMYYGTSDTITFRHFNYHVNVITTTKLYWQLLVRDTIKNHSSLFYSFTKLKRKKLWQMLMYHTQACYNISEGFDTDKLELLAELFG